MDIFLIFFFSVLAFALFYSWSRTFSSPPRNEKTINRFRLKEKSFLRKFFRFKDKPNKTFLNVKVIPTFISFIVTNIFFAFDIIALALNLLETYPTFIKYIVWVSVAYSLSCALYVLGFGLYFKLTDEKMM